MLDNNLLDHIYAIHVFNVHFRRFFSAPNVQVVKLPMFVVKLPMIVASIVFQDY